MMLKIIFKLENVRCKALIPKISFFLTITNDYSLSKQSWLSDLYEVFFFFSFLRASVV